MHLIAPYIDSLITFRLPDFQVIDYTAKFDYQDGAFGIGLNLFRK